jgi:1-deoxy-D-xylulose-5-phosphate reductoisomerase
MPVSITILGSTGSIGVSALRVLRSLGGEFRVRGLSCHRNLGLLEEQLKEFAPEAAAVGAMELVSPDDYRALKRRFGRVEFLEGEEGIRELASRGADIVISAIVGSAGLAPTLAAVPRSRRIALANKETLVMAGDLFMRAVREHGVELLPVDSEHSAVFSLLQGMDRGDVRRIVLTASGGSLRERAADELDHVTPGEALAHPTWEMGDKITIDSATLMNKGLEVIEAHHLFGMDYDSIGVIIHPESIVHSMVETVDGAVYAHLGVADMALPILAALTHPRRCANPFGRLDLTGVGSLTFHAYDALKFPAVELCYHAGRSGGTAPAVLNGANEAAVGAFLSGRIRFTDIVKIVEKTVKRHYTVKDPSIEQIYSADGWARETAEGMIRG